MMKILTTNRLRLRPFDEHDAEAMFKNWTFDDRVAHYCRWYPHQSIHETKQYLSLCMEKEYCWAITLKEKDEPIGCIDVVGIDHRGAAEIGYVLAYDYWNKGFMSEAAFAVIEELFHCGFETITACHALDNPASGKVMEKSGMIYIRNDMAQKKFGSSEQIEVQWYEIHRKKA